MKELCKSEKSVGIITLMAMSFALFFFFQSPQAAEAVTVTVAPTNTAPAGITQGRKDDFARLDLTTDAGTALWLGISVNLIGTATDSDINYVTIYKSADANWANTDLVIGGGNVSGGVANITL
ncbi:MAG: hypothetical protein KAX16_02905, partial [Actinomycetia bacterium]|nr:hypothetical protein [Actinomycetes bacterium]